MTESPPTLETAQSTGNEENVNFSPIASVKFE